MLGHTVMVENGVQQGAEHAPLLDRAGFRHRSLSFMMSLEGTMVLKAEL